MEKEKVEEFFGIFEKMAEAKHLNKSFTELVRTFTSLSGAYIDNGWRVVGITAEAYKAFELVNFERIPTRRDPIAVERAHINKRYDWINELFTRKWEDPQAWWDFIYENDKTVLATTFENKMSDTQGIPLEIAYEIPDTGEYFKTQFISCKYRKKVEKVLLESFKKK